VIRKQLVSLAISTLLFYGACAPAHILERPPFTGHYKYTDPHEAVQVFLKAVDRGELTVFDRKIEKSMLVPVRVEYVYELDSAVPTIKVYSRLKEPIAIPGSETCKVYEVGAILDASGTIIKIESHVRTE
jgi:hypothetical protein